jgi:fructose-1,6-bisphosphatase
MTPEQAVHYLADQSRLDSALEQILFKAAESHADIYAWAEEEPERVVAIAESWQDVVSQTPPGLDPL